MSPPYSLLFFFFFNDTATTEIYTLSLHDALPICVGAGPAQRLGRDPPAGRLDDGQRGQLVAAVEGERGEDAADEVRRADAVAGVARRRVHGAAGERHDGRQARGRDVDRPAPGVVDPAALEHRE